MREGIDKDYWDDYYDFWDAFVRNWFEQGYEKPNDEDAKAFCRAVKGLVLNELPNPYFGDPKNGVDAVIINLNPGGSEKDENKAGTDATQFYSNLKDTNKENGKGWLMWKFVDDAKCSYKRFVGNDDDDKSVNWSQLNPKLRWYRPEVCGVKWWQGLLKDEKDGEELYDGRRRKVIHSSKKRIEWMRRIYNNPWLDPAKVFALELCPYHSKSFNFDSKKLDKNNRNHVFKFIADHVIHPALTAVVENQNLDFAVAIGKTTAIYLEQQLKEIEGGEYGIEAKLEKEWWDRTDGIKELGWPTTIDQKTHEKRLTYRKYCLFALKDKDERLARFLVCVAKGPGANSVPGEEFEEKIEKNLIREYVRTNPLTREYYERIQPLKPMHWWKESKDKTVSSKAKPKQRGAQKPKPASVPNQDKTQLYKNLWSGFSEWCKDNKKAWFTENVNYENNYIKPVGARKPCVLFKIDASGQLHLGIYCSKSIWKSIKKECTANFERISAYIDWGNQDNDKDITILFPFTEDWRNPNKALFNKMADTFESVRDVLRDKGFL